MSGLRIVVTSVLRDERPCVFRGATSAGRSIRVVQNDGRGLAPMPGDALEVLGEWTSHPQHGKQLVATNVVRVRPGGEVLLDVLTHSPRFPGIGAARARKLWDALGTQLFDVLDAGEPHVLADHVGAELANTLVRGWRELGDEASTCRWLSEKGIAPRLARKIMAIYGALPIPPDARAEAERVGAAVWHLEQDPYRLLAMASWRAVDQAALQMGIQAEDERRLAGAVEATLSARLLQAHTLTDPGTLAGGVRALLHCDAPRASQAIDVAVKVGAAVLHSDGYQLSGCFVMERYIEQRCVDMLEGRWCSEQMRLEARATAAEIDATIETFCAVEGIALNAEQSDAVHLAYCAPLSCLVGGPGVGKTTVLKAVHVVSETYGRRVVQAALSGRAAQRMAEATDRPASTIASLLVRVDRGEEALDDEPLIVLDEASMIDLPTLYRLMRVSPPGSRLLLVGDPGQLPPVGFGLTFHEIAKWARVPRVTLARVMRQADSTGIPHVCSAIRDGTVPLLPPWSPAAREGVSVLPCNPSDVTDRVVDLLAHYGRGSTQVIGSIKAGAGGVEEVNERLHAITALGGEAAGPFFVGEPVVATRNDYTLGVMNGELGTVLGAADDGALTVAFDTGEKLVPKEYLPDLDLAYAITCHKAQGSQFRRVIVLTTPNRLLDRSLLLTAVSRAQDQVILVGDSGALEAGITSPASSSQREIGLGR